MQIYNQYEIDQDAMESTLKISRGRHGRVKLFFMNKGPISVELPNSVIREIIYTEPAVKGDTTSGKVMKPAKLSTDFELMVPIFCDNG